jgi:hypothetical protein
LPVKLLATAVFLDHHVRDFIDAFVRGVTALTRQALSPAADRVTLLTFAGIYNFIL